MVDNFRFGEQWAIGRSQLILRVSYTSISSRDYAEYLGTARPGSTDASSSWRIQQMTYDADANVTEINYADGDIKFDNVWDVRSALSYS